MSISTTLRRIVRSGFTNFWRNRYVAAASVLVLSVTLFVVGALILGAAFLNSTLTEIKDRVDISVTFKSDASEEAVLSLKQSLELLPEVRSVEYSSREDELESFRQRHEDNALLIQSLDEVGNPFGARLSILALDPSQYETIARFLQSYTQGNPSDVIVDQINFKQDIIEKLLAVIATSQKVGMTISVLLIVMSILVTFNTISLAIYITRDEISVMRLVGASNFYVRGPFMVEGMIAGVIASFVAVFALYPTVIWVRNTTSGVYGGINLVSYYLENFAYVFGIILLSGIVLGLVSSYLATRKYLKI